MKKLVLLLLLATLLFTQSPRPYAALGDKIYNNAFLLENIQEIPEFSVISDKLKVYIKEVEVAKKKGYALEASESGITKKEYLLLLRKLDKTNKYYLRFVDSTYKTAIKDENSELFVMLINSGLIDVEQYKKEILNYYDKHQEDIEIAGIIKLFLDEKSKKVKKRGLTYAEIQAAKIKKQNDKAKQEALSKQLSDEVLQKKIDIRENQKKELAN